MDASALGAETEQALGVGPALESSASRRRRLAALLLRLAREVHPDCDKDTALKVGWLLCEAIKFAKGHARVMEGVAALRRGGTPAEQFIHGATRLQLAAAYSWIQQAPATRGRRLDWISRSQFIHYLCGQLSLATILHGAPNVPLRASTGILPLCCSELAPWAGVAFPADTRRQQRAISLALRDASIPLVTGRPARPRPGRSR